MHPLRFGLIVAGLVCFIGISQAKDKPEPFPTVADSGPLPAAEQKPYVPKDMGYKGLVEAQKAQILRLEAELKERKQAANHWYAQYLEYKALCQRYTNYKQVSSKGSWKQQCNGNSCKLVWVPDSQPTAPKKSEPVKQAASAATPNRGVPTSRRVFAGRWFR